MGRRGIKQLAFAAAATMVLFATTGAGVGTAAAHTTADLRAGAYTDANGLAIGGGLVTDLSRRDSWMFNPNLEIAFPDGGNVFTMNADFHYEFPTAGSLGIYAGGGPAIVIADPNVGSSQTNAGLNLIGGVMGRRGNMHPFGQAKLVVSDNNEFALMGGVRF